MLIEVFVQPCSEPDQGPKPSYRVEKKHIKVIFELDQFPVLANWRQEQKKQGKNEN